MVDPVVKLESGSVRGVVEKHEEGFDYYAFKGVPYAEPPVGELRFQDPIPKKAWTGVIDCKNDGPMCLQFELFLQINSYAEDCLYLNVFTQTINDINKNSPVMLIIHGGAGMFNSASSWIYGPDHLIRKDVVLVMPNFRLGVLGFLDLEDEIAPGNQGLKDLVMVLEWVQRNIRTFGGDPDNVTVFGALSGAAFAHYLALSPLTKGLIHRVISGGGVVYNPWTAITNPKSHAIQLCSLLGKELTDSTEILKFLKSLDAKKLQQAQESLRKALYKGFPFGAGIDSKSLNPFMPVHRYTAADKSVHLPFLVGCNARDGLALLNEDFFKVANRDFGQIFRYGSKDILDRYGLSEIQVRGMYYKNEAVSEKNLDKFVDLASDIYFIEGIHRCGRVQAEQSSAATYLYLFDYQSKHSICNMLLENIADEDKQGCGHFDELPFLFRTRFFEERGLPCFEKGSRSCKMMEQMTEMWTNFARYGKPTAGTSNLIPVHWLPIANGTTLRYLHIGEDITMKSIINLEQKFLSAKNIVV